MNSNDIATAARNFIFSLKTSIPGEYRFCPDGQVSLYSSCYAAMALHYVDALQKIAQSERLAWCDYINSWQDPQSGLFVGPELAAGELVRPELYREYAALHLAITVLPALELLGGRPAQPLQFATQFADMAYLQTWLAARDWRHAWKEGNNLLFAGQLLIHLRDNEGLTAAQQALDFYFDWLDAQQDPETGLWGTNGYCSPYPALYGAYHQLLVYYYCERPVHYAARIVDTVLELQQPDGSFSRTPGGGACEDVDAVDVLINLTKRTGYRTSDVRQALTRALPHILRQQAPDGGFVYRWGRSYMQSGALRTFTPANTADIFSTWFRLHTLALIAQVVDDPRLNGVSWSFNHSCSMGWHDKSLKLVPQERGEITASKRAAPLKERRSSRHIAGSMLRNILRRVPASWVLRAGNSFLPRYIRMLPSGEGLHLLLQLEDTLDVLGKERSYEVGQGLHVPFWWSQHYRVFAQQVPPGAEILHLGCGSGSLSFTLASLSGGSVTAADAELDKLIVARQRYHHPHLSFIPPEQVVAELSPDIIVMTDLVQGRPAWDRWAYCWHVFRGATILAQVTPTPTNWSNLEPSTAVTGRRKRSIPDSTLEVPAGWHIVAVDDAWGSQFITLRLACTSIKDNLDGVEARV